MARGLLLVDYKLPDVQPAHLELLYLKALDPSALHSERPDGQGAYGHCSSSARANR